MRNHDGLLLARRGISMTRGHREPVSATPNLGMCPDKAHAAFSLIRQLARCSPVSVRRSVRARHRQFAYRRVAAMRKFPILRVAGDPLEVPVEC